MSAFDRLHPAVQYHVVNTLGWSALRPTQLEAIDPIQAGLHCLLLAPTAAGKTEAAVIPILSRMLTETWPGTSVLYVCPIKALLNNLEHRLSHYAALVGRRVAVWHGDVSQSQKQRSLRDAPDILLTTPESIEGMLISTRVERETWFANLRAVVVDELHAFAAGDRGWHLRSVIHRLEHYTPHPVQRIGLSATVSNPDELLHWFAPIGERKVVGSAAVSTDADVTIDHVGSLDNAATVIDRLHRGSKRLVFCDSRSSAEQLSSALRGKGIRAFVSHASLSQSERKLAETAFTEERDCVIVATSTLELGIDVGDLDHVIQIDSPSTVSSFLQRMGRTGRRAGAIRNFLFLATNDDALLLALGIVRKWSERWVEAAVPPPEPWGIVVQQALAATLERGQWAPRELVALLVGAFPELPKDDIAALVQHLVSKSYLVSDSGLLQIGAVTEREFGRSHYLDLLASFSGSPLLTGRYGSAEVGYIDPTVLTGEKADRLILLGGRSWRVTEIEWKRRIVWLEPAKEGGTARWIGGGRGMGPEVSEAIRAVVVDGPPDGVTLSKRAVAKLDELRDSIPAPATSSGVIVRHDDGSIRWWTFAGTNANRSYAKLIAATAQVRKFDGLGLDLSMLVEGTVLPDLHHAALAFSTPELELASKGIKFSECLPVDLLERVVSARMYGAEGE